MPSPSASPHGLAHRSATPFQNYFRFWSEKVFEPPPCRLERFRIFFSCAFLFSAFSIAVISQGAEVSLFQESFETDGSPAALALTVGPPAYPAFGWVNPLPAGGTLLAVSEGGGRLVAVGADGLILSSNDGGLNWTERDSSFAGRGNLNGVAYADTLNLWAAVGNQGAVLTSTDGAISWSLAFAPHTYEEAFNDVAFAAGRFVVVGNNGQLITSADGINWTPRDAGSDGIRLLSAAYGGNLWAVGREDGVFLTSADGVNWTQTASGSAHGVYGLIHDGARFVGVGGDTLFTSADGSNWTVTQPADFPYARDIALRNGLYVALGDGGGLAASPDLATWTPADFGTGVSLWSVAGPADAFVGVGTGRTILRSADGTNWTSQGADGAVEALFDGLYEPAGGQFVLVGANGKIFTSADGIEWTEQAGAVGNWLEGIAHGNGTFVAVGHQGSVTTSPDAVNWTDRTIGLGENFRGAAFGPVGGGIFVAAGNGGLLYSSADNGAVWTAHSSPAGGTNLSDVAFGNGLFVAAGEGGTLLSSPDGINWSARDSGTGANLHAVAFAEGHFAAAGDGELLHSADGSNWERVFLPAGSLLDAAFVNGTWLAGGDDGQVFASQDLETWLPARLRFAETLEGLAAGNGLAAAFGTGGHILLSTISEQLDLVPPDFVWTNPLPIGGGLNGAAEGAGRIIAAGNGGLILASDDGGASWQENPSPLAEGRLTGVAYANIAGVNRWVAVSDSGDILTSGDHGESWDFTLERHTYPEFHAVAYAAGQFLAAGGGGNLFTSPDGVAFTLRETGFGGNSFLSVAHGNALWAVGVDSGSILTSPDGINWTERATGTDHSIEGLLFDGSGFLGVGGPYVVASSDGIAWSVSQPDNFVYANEVGFNNGLHVALQPADNHYAYSANGVDWTNGPLPLPAPPMGIAATATGFVLVGNGRGIQTSADGIAWQSTGSEGGFFSANDGVHADGRFVVVGAQGHILVSENGVDWSAQQPSGDWLEGVAHGAGLFVAVGHSGVIHTSPDAAQWTHRGLGIGERFLGIAYGNGAFVAAGDAGVLFRSPDGIAWTAQPSGTGETLYDIAFGTGLFAAVGSGSAILTSPDGIAWTARDSGVPFNLEEIEYANGLFMAGGEQTAILTSPDGVEWTHRSLERGESIRAIAFFENAWHAAGDNGLFAFSPDAEHWAALTVGFHEGFFGMVSADALHTLLLFGEGGNILTAFEGQFAITEQPQNLTLFEGQTAALETTAFGKPPLTYQWRRNGQDIVGANGPVLNIENARLSDSGTYTVVVSDADNGVLSSNEVALVIQTFVIGGWEEVDNFEDGALLEWAINNSEANGDGFINLLSDPIAAASGNSVLEVDPGTAVPDNFRARIDIPEILHQENSAATFFLRFAKQTDVVDVVWGLTPVADPQAFADYSVSSRFQTDGIFDVRDGNDPGYVDISSLAPQTWYEAWFVIRPFENRFDVYLRGGTEFPDQVLVYADANFRNQTADSLINFLITTTTGQIDDPKGEYPMYFDDIYIDLSGENLTSPVFTSPIANPGLEAAIRETLGKPDGKITVGDLESLTTLNAIGRGITDLSGLEFAVNLTSLDLRHNVTLSDLSPLSGLNNLQSLDLGENSVSDLTPLQNLVGLRSLYVWDNELTDIGPLAGLINLESLSLSQNQISDVSPLSGLTNLRRLEIFSNQIREIDPLAGLTGLEVIFLNDNLLRNIDALGGITNPVEVEVNNNFLIVGEGSGARQVIDALNAITANSVIFEPQNDFFGNLPPLAERMEAFETGLGNFTEARGLDTGSNNFGWSVTNNAGMGAGEFGGTFNRTDDAGDHWIGDIDIGDVSRTDKIKIGGNFFIQENLNADGSIEIGFTNRAIVDANPISRNQPFVGIVINEPSGSGVNYRARSTSGTTLAEATRGTLPALGADRIPLGVMIHFDFTWTPDPAAPGNGHFEAVFSWDGGGYTSAGDEFGSPDEAEWTFDTFKVGMGPSKTFLEGRRTIAWIDDLTYTVGDRIETFDAGLGHFTELRGLNTGANDFGWSVTNNAGTVAGEFGGAFNRTDDAGDHWIGDVNIGNVSRTGALNMSGNFFIEENLNADGSIEIGFTNRAIVDANPISRNQPFVGIVINEPSGSDVNYRARATSGTTLAEATRGTLPALGADRIPVGVMIHFEFTWAPDPAAPGNGHFEAAFSWEGGGYTSAGDELGSPDEAEWTFDTFKVGMGPSKTFLEGRRTIAWIDDLTYTLGSANSVPAEVRGGGFLLFQESFETDGSVATGDGRYAVENPSDDGGDNFFARREAFSAGTRTSGGTLEGNWFWGARDIDALGGFVNDLEADEGRLTLLNPINTTGIGELQLTLAAAQGDAQFEFDNVLLIQIWFDPDAACLVDPGISGCTEQWTTIGGFRGIGTNNDARFFVGAENTIPDPNSAPALTNDYQDFNFPIFGRGATLALRIKINANGGTEEYDFDNIRITGNDAVSFFALSLDNTTISESAGDGAATLMVTLDNPAPSGGVTLNVSAQSSTSVRGAKGEISIAETISFVEGATVGTASINAIDDERFDGDQVVSIIVGGDAGFNADSIELTVTNNQVAPNLVINEFLAGVPGSIPEDLVGDANGDGLRDFSQDEFVEFVNKEDFAVDLSFWMITDNIGPRHIIPDGTILGPGKAIVVFGGGNPLGIFGGAIIQTASVGNLGLNNTGDTISLIAGGATVTSHTYEGDVGQSGIAGVRSPELTGDFVLHNTVSDLLFSPGTQANGTTPFINLMQIFQESFETDGSVATGEGRYTVENQSDDGSRDFFNRRVVGSAGTRVRGGVVDGDFYWGARDLDGDGVPVNDLANEEGRITWNNPIDISGLGNLTLTVSVAQGDDEQEFDNPLAFQYQIDGGPWLTAGGFRGLHTNSPSYVFEGGNFGVSAGVVPMATDARLTRTFKDWEFRIFGSGDAMRFRVFVNANGGLEEYGFDNIRLSADDSLFFFDLSVNKNTFVETDGSAAGLLTITTPIAVAEGGVTFSLEDSDADNTEADLPSEVSIPGGGTSVSVPFDILADGRFDGDEPVIIQLSAPGWAREQITFTVTNGDPKPNLVVNEIYPDPFNGFAPEDLQGDSNNDGVRNDDEDEFMEIVNLETFPVDISFWELWDERGPRHIFPAGTVLGAGEAVVVFGGGDPRGLFGGALFDTASQGNFSFNPFGENVSLRAGGTNTAGAIVDDFTFTGNLGTTMHSITRNPDGTGAFVDHATAAPGGAFFSPGTQTDGTPFFSFADTLSIAFDSGTVAEDAGSIDGTVSLTSPAPADGLLVSLAAEGDNPDELILPATVTIPEGATQIGFTAQAVNDGVLDGNREVAIRATSDNIFPALTYLTITEIEPNPFNIVINEILGSILGTNFDFNGNGIVEEPVEDQFIEIVNIGTSNVDLSGWTVRVARTDEPDPELLVHTFPSGTVLAPQSAIVIFGGGDEADLQALSADLFGGALVQVAKGSFNGVNLTDKGDGRITLLTPNGFLEDRVEYPIENSNQAMALTRSPDLTGNFGALHFEVSTAFELASPGRQLDGAPFPNNGKIILDPGLEAAIRETLGKPDGKLTIGDLESLTGLNAIGRGIADLRGLEFAVNLTALDLRHNVSISDLSPLSGLNNLQSLDLGENAVSDLSPLQNLVGLRSLYVWNNDLTDIGPLAGLINLESLSLSQNQISDVSPLSGLTNLRRLEIFSNRIREIDPLAGLTGLEVIFLNDNLLQNIDALGGITNPVEVEVNNNFLIVSEGSGARQVIDALNAISANSVIFEPQSDFFADLPLLDDLEDALEPIWSNPVNGNEGVIDLVETAVGLSYTQNGPNSFLGVDLPLQGYAPADRDWRAEVRVHIDALALPSRIAAGANFESVGLGFTLTNNSDPSDFLFSNGQQAFNTDGTTVLEDGPFVVVGGFTDGGFDGNFGRAPHASTEVVLRMEWDAASRTLRNTYMLEDGTLFDLADVELGDRWQLQPGDTFTLAIEGFTNTDLVIAAETAYMMDFKADDGLVLFQDTQLLDDLKGTLDPIWSAADSTDFSAIALVEGAAGLSAVHFNVLDTDRNEAIRTLQAVAPFNGDWQVEMNVSAPNPTVRLTSVEQVNQLEAIYFEIKVFHAQRPDYAAFFEYGHTAFRQDVSNIFPSRQLASGDVLENPDLPFIFKTRDLDVPDVLLRVTWDSAAQLLRLSYEVNGVIFDYGGIDPVERWGMQSGNTFEIAIGVFSFNTQLVLPADELFGMDFAANGLTLFNELVNMPDAGLEGAIRDALGKPDGQITVGDLNSLNSLTAAGLNIAELTGMEAAHNLTDLNLIGNQISDLSPLSSLTNLLSLNLDDNFISDPSPLSDLTGLETLFLGGNQISDFSSLSGLNNLRTFSLGTNQVSDLSPLAGMTLLGGLFLDGNQITDISVLSGLTGLTFITLEGNQVNDISALSGLTGLVNLRLSGNQIGDLSPLSNLTALVDLVLEDNQVNDVSPLSGLTNLRRLELQSNRIREIGPLSGLTGLEVIFLNDNLLQNIDALAGLTNPVEVEVNNNFLIVSEGSGARQVIDALNAISANSVIFEPQNDIFAGLRRLPERSETFDTGLGHFTEVRGLDTGSNDLGWSATNNAGAAAGEFGGTFNRTDNAGDHWIGDVDIGNVNRKDKIKISGNFFIQENLNADGSIEIGFTNRALVDADPTSRNYPFVGIDIFEPSGSDVNYRAAAFSKTQNGRKRGTFPELGEDRIPVGVMVHFDFTWTPDPLDPGNGHFEAAFSWDGGGYTSAGDELSSPDASEWTFDTFKVGMGPSKSFVDGRQTIAWIDDLTYSVGDRVETFDADLGHFTEVRGLDTGSNNLGWSDTNNAGTAAGEFGGTFNRTDNAGDHWIGDVDIGNVSRTGEINISGNFFIQENLNADGSIEIGFTNRAIVDANPLSRNYPFVGIDIFEPSGSDVNYRAAAFSKTRNGRKRGTFPELGEDRIPVGVVIHFDFTWTPDPLDPGNGHFEASFNWEGGGYTSAGDELSSPDASEWTFDTFKVGNGPSGSFLEGRQTIAWIDDLAYTRGPGTLSTDEPPVIERKRWRYVNPDEMIVIDGSVLSAVDREQDPPETILFTVNEAPAKGTLSLNGSPLAANGTFTQADVNSGLLTFTADPIADGVDNFSFTVQDAGGVTGEVATLGLQVGLPVQVVKRLDGNGTEDDRLGRVDLSGDTMVAGALRGDGNAVDTGAAYVFERNQGGTDNWGEVKVLQADDGESGDRFGSVAAVDADTIILGAESESDLGDRAGAAYLYERDSGGVGNWGQVRKLTADDGEENDRFGFAVGISGETAVVGAPLEDAAGVDTGAVYIFEREAGGAGNWGQTAKLTPIDGAAGDLFGVSVAVHGDHIIIGSERNDVFAVDAGAAYIFKRDTSDPNSWNQIAKLVAQEGREGDRFGRGVDINGDTAVAGATFGDSNPVDSGAVYVFQRDQGGPDVWGQVKQLDPVDIDPLDTFGFFVSIDGDVIAASASADRSAGELAGASYVFGRNEGGPDNWGLLAKLKSNDLEAFDRFGSQVAVFGERVAIAAFGDDDNGTDAGAVYVFEPFSPVPLEFSSSTSAFGSFGQFFAYQIESSNFPVAFQADGLPAGLLLDPQTGLISGAPEVSGTFDVIVTAESATGSISQIVSLVLDTAISITPAQIFQEIDFEVSTLGDGNLFPGQAPNEYREFLFGFNPGATLASDTIQGIDANPALNATQQGRLGGSFSSGGTLESNLPASGFFFYEVFPFEAFGGLLDPLILGTPALFYSTDFLIEKNASAGGQSWQVFIWDPGAGQPLLRLEFRQDGSIHIGDSSFSGSASDFTQIKGVSFAFDTPYGLDIRVNHETREWSALLTDLNDQSVQVLADNRPLDPDTTRFVDGQSLSFLVNNFDAVNLGDDILFFDNVVSAALPRPALFNLDPVTATAGALFQFAVEASDFTDSFDAIGLPSGLSIDPFSGLISGVATVDGTFNVEIRAENPNGITTGNLEIQVAPQAPVITSGLTAQGRVDAAFFYQITATNGPTAFSAANLPPGLGIDTSTGLLNGTPTEEGLFNVEIGATNAGGTTPSTLSANILPSNLPPVITSPSFAGGTANSPFSYAITATRNPTGFAATGLPAGLSLNAVSGLISGSPAGPGTFPAELTATNIGGTSVPLTLIISINPDPNIPVISSASSANGRVNVSFSNFQIAATNSPTAFSATGLPPGLTLDAAGLIAGTPTLAGNFTALITAANASGTSPAQEFFFTIFPPLQVPVISSSASVAGTAVELLEIQLTASNNPTGFFALNLPTGLAVDSGTGLISGLPAASGIFDAFVSAENGDGLGPSLTVRFDIASPPAVPTIAGNSTVPALVGSPFTFQIQASGDPFQYFAANLPPGLTLNAATGFIAGTPTQIGTFPVTLTAENADGLSEPAVLTVIVGAPPATPEIISSTSAQGQSGESFSYQIVATEGPITAFSATGLPSGLSLDPASGVISGLPDQSGQFVVALSASNQNGNGDVVDLILNIAPPPSVPVITSSASASGTQGESFNFQITATNNPTGFQATGLPSGISLNTLSGLISGIPSVTGSFTLAVSAANPGGTSLPLDVVMSIIPAASAPVIFSSLSLTGFTDTQILYEIQATDMPVDRPLPPGFSFNASNLPLGLSLNPGTGIITGFPDEPGIFVTSIWAVNEVGAGEMKNLVFDIQRGAEFPNIISPSFLVGDVGQALDVALVADKAALGYELVGGDGFFDLFDLSSIDGQYSLNPILSGETTFQARAGLFNANGNWIWGDFAPISATLVPALQTPVITSPATALATAGEAFLYQITASNMPTDFSAVFIPFLPSGITFNSLTGEMSGTPQNPGTFNIFLQASNAAGVGLPKELSLIIDPAPGTPDVGGGGAGSTGLNLKGGAPGLKTTKITFFTSGQVGVPFTFTLSATGNPTRFEADNIPPDLALNPATGELSGIPSTQGNFLLPFTAFNIVGQGGTAFLEIEILPRAGTPVITSSLAESGQAGNALSYAITATENPLGFNAGNLPAFLSLDGVAGTISGTLTQPGLFEIALSANNGIGTGGTAILALNVAAESGTPIVDSPAQTFGTAKEAFSFEITARNNPLNFFITNLPAGLLLDGANGMITGTPLQLGELTVQVFVENSLGFGDFSDLTFSIAPAPGTPQITSSDLFRTVLNDPEFTFPVTADNNPDSFNFDVLPAGITFDPLTGLLKGVPETTGGFQIVFSANNAIGEGAGQVFVLNVFTSRIQLWKSENFFDDSENPAISGDTADPDRDGIPNLLEYALLLNPNLSDRMEISAIKRVVIEGTEYLAVTFKRRQSADVLTYSAEVSSDLITWTSEAGLTNNFTTLVSVEDPVAGDDAETVTVRDNLPLSNFTTRFLRIKVDNPENP